MRTELPTEINEENQGGILHAALGRGGHLRGGVGAVGSERLVKPPTGGSG